MVLTREGAQVMNRIRAVTDLEARLGTDRGRSWTRLRVMSLSRLRVMNLGRAARLGTETWRVGLWARLQVTSSEKGAVMSPAPRVREDAQVMMLAHQVTSLTRPGTLRGCMSHVTRASSHVTAT